MNNNKNILILNTGGTFNKVYNELNGKLIVPKDNSAIDKIIKSIKIETITVKGLIYKDSLDIDKQDRKELVSCINSLDYKKIIIIHGTDTMGKTASYLNKYIKNKQIVLTGAMIPFSIDSIEATANLMSAYGFILNCSKDDTYISMHGLVKKFNKIKKNREIGVFQ